MSYLRSSCSCSVRPASSNAIGAASTPGLHYLCRQRGELKMETPSVHTCPPEKPTATRPSSLGLARNLGWIVDASMAVLGERLEEVVLRSPRQSRAINSSSCQFSETMVEQGTRIHSYTLEYRASLTFQPNKERIDQISIFRITTFQQIRGAGSSARVQLCNTIKRGRARCWPTRLVALARETGRQAVTF